jgi:2-(1,2-epoxy-1,2-dihydrophenyl)acetyl-CoA isomerase
VRCLLLTGTGRAFCAGANLTDPDRPSPRDRQAEASGAAKSELETWYNPMFIRLRNLPIPYIAAVNGVAAGVGMSFALSADLVIAAKSSYFLQAFARIGLVPDGGSTWILTRRVGVARAMELSMLAEKLPAETAMAWGAVNRVVEDSALMTEATALAKRLAAGPSVAYGLIRKAYWESLENDYPAQLQLEADLQKQAGRTTDHAEGIAAFKEKRQAVFTGH